MHYQPPLKAGQLRTPAKRLALTDWVEPEPAPADLPTPPDAAQAPEVVLPTVQEIEQIREAAFQEGYSEGYQQGQGQGQQQGREQGQRQGYEEGYQQGQQEGQQAGQQQAQEQAKAEIDSHLQAVQQMVQALQEPLHRWQHSIETALAQTLVVLCRHCLLAELSLPQPQIMAIVTQAVQALPLGQSRLRLRISAVDQAHLQALALQRLLDQTQHLTIEVDAQLGGGECCIDSDDSLIDFTLSQRFNQQIQALIQHYHLPQQDLFYQGQPEQGPAQVSDRD